MKIFRSNGEVLHDFADNGWMDHTCSVCKYRENTDVHVHVDWKYCPRCGAKFTETPEENIPKGFQEEIQEGQCLVSIEYKPYRVYSSGSILVDPVAWYECSLCGRMGVYDIYDGDRIQRPIWNYCPECGASLELKFQRE